MATINSTWLNRLFYVLWPAILLMLGFLMYGSTGHDDSHIHLWNVHTLLTQDELTNYNGERIEQSSSLLQDFITAFLAVFTHANTVTLGYLVDIISALGCCVLSKITAKQCAPSLTAWTGTLILSSASFLLWSFGGLGAPLTALCLLMGTYCWWKWLTTGAYFFQTTLTTFALVLVRPEMPVVIIAITTTLIVISFRQAEQQKRAWILFAITLTSSIALFAWQQWYFGSWLPVPAIAKQGGLFSAQLQRGTYYIIFGWALNPVTGISLLLSLPLLFIFAKKWLKKTLTSTDWLSIILLTSFLTYTGFIWTSGGDWMQANRFFVPIIPIAVLLFLHVLQKLPNKILAAIILLAITTIQFSLQYPVIARQSHGIPIWVQSRVSSEHAARYGIFEQLNQEHVRDFSVIDHLHDIIPLLRNTLQRPVILMSGQAGMVFYYTAQQFYGQVIFRDLRGLAEDSFTLCPALKNLPRSPQGLMWSYHDFFEQLPELQKTCGITAPDIIYDINDMTQKLSKTLEPYGYTLIHRETGFIVDNKTALPYNRLLSPNMIFIRNALLPTLGENPVRVINYADLPLQSRWPLRHAP